MKSKKLGLWVLLLLLGVSVWLNISTYLKENPMSEVLSQKGAIILSPSVTESLLSDIKLGDKARMEQWWSYLYLSAGYDTNLNVASGGLNQTFELYEAKEKPGRSNYFNRLVWDLRMKQAASPLSKQALLGFLGQPDATMEGPEGQTLQYKYWSSGRNCISSVLVSNDMVSRIEIYVE